tara:strand:+ start:107 stop:307 length:201 start_codon:yes stop_codon:yes gene_type:complete
MINRVINLSKTTSKYYKDNLVLLKQKQKQKLEAEINYIDLRVKWNKKYIKREKMEIENINDKLRYD